VSRPLLVVALGGNAVSPPAGRTDFAGERAAIDAVAAELAAPELGGARLLVVHGNGPQVGRLLAAPGLGEPTCLDVHVAQTQGELGYLLAEALERRLAAPCAALVTRAVVTADDPAFAAPTKPVGVVLHERPPEGAAGATPDGRGWRRLVASPRPHTVVELAAIRALLVDHHVVAGGGGGVALAARDGARRPCAAVIDKDWVACLLAVRLDADRLLFVTDVPYAFDEFGRAGAAPIAVLRAAEARERLARGVFAPGSMGPKIESAAEFVEATGRVAVVTAPGAIAAAVRGERGTRVRP
jgi:carbamate kinase